VSWCPPRATLTIQTVGKTRDREMIFGGCSGFATICTAHGVSRVLDPLFACSALVVEGEDQDTRIAMRAAKRGQSGAPDTKGNSAFRNAAIDGGEVTLRVTNCRASHKLPRPLYLQHRTRIRPGDRSGPFADSLNKSCTFLRAKSLSRVRTVNLLSVMSDTPDLGM